MVMKHPLGWILLLLMSWALAACQWDSDNSDSRPNPSTDSGSLSLSINQPSSRLLQPDVSLDVANYRIQGVGPAGASLDETVDASGSATIDFLRFGTWNIMVEAINADGYIFARGSQEVVINVDETTNATITVSMLEGVGSLQLEVSWPQAEVQSSLLNGFLRADGQSDIPLNFVSIVGAEGDETFSALHTDTIPAGYYTLIVTVHDQGTGSANHLAMGVAETVRILEGQMTTGTFELNGTPGLGSIAQNILLDADEPIAVALDDPQTLPSSFAYDSDTQFTVSASVDAGDEDFGSITFVWYLNGELLAIANSYNFDSAASPQTNTVNGRFLPGHYRVDVIAFNTDGSRAGSMFHEFDVTGNPTGISLPEEFGTVTGQVGIFIADEDDQVFVPLLGSQILVGGRSAMANAEGIYTVDFVAAGNQTVQVVEDGYFSAFKPVVVTDQQTTNVDRILLRATEEFPVDATTGGSVATSGGATVNFGANVIVDEDGNPYTGTVTVKATSVDPLSNDFFEAFPGDFTGLTEGGDVVDIISFGAIAVELEDTNGNELEIAEGQTVEIRIEVADPDNAPPTLPLWYLDEETGQWTEEGSATLMGNEYVGSVSHFSWWNFDYRPTGVNDGWFATGSISGRVVDADNNPVAGADVTLNSVAGLNWAQSTTSDAAGNFTVQAYLARNQSDPYYAAYARKDGLQSEPVSIRINQASGQNITGVEIKLQAPEITMTAEGKIGASRQTLIDNGPQLRFGDRTITGTITLRNPSIDGLEITAISITDDTDSVFTLSRANPAQINGATGRPRGNLNSGDTMVFYILYRVPGNGAQSTANLVVTRNNPDNPSAPISMTYPLEAGTSLTDPVTETVTLTHLSTHIGYMLRDGDLNVFAVNTDTETAAFIFEDNPDAFRNYFAVDTSILPGGIASVSSVNLKSSSVDHNGLNLYQGQQGALLDSADFDPATGTFLNSVTIPATSNASTTLNQEGINLFETAITSPSTADNIIPLMLQAVDIVQGTVDLTSLEVEITYVR